MQRLDEGFDLTQVVAELSMLRDCILKLWEQSVLDPSRLIELRIVNQAIDRAVSASVERFTRARDRTLIALDRIANEALESRSLDELLQRLLQVFVDTTAAVDTAVILIREGDELRVRAARGVEAEAEREFTLRIGEGFAGKIAADRQPVSLQSAATDPLVKSAALRARGIRALYGVPLMDVGDVIGVAHMGSLTAHELSQQDKRLFAAMASRASAAIHQHMLRERADRAAAELRAVLESIPAAIYIGAEGRVRRANAAGLALLGYESSEQLESEPVLSLASELQMRDAASGRLLARHEGPLHGADTREQDLVVRSRATRRDLVMHSITAPIELAGKPMGVVSVNIDVTARQHIESALRERELEFRTLADNIPQLAWITDASGFIYWYNQRWFEFTGTTLADVEGSGWQRVHHPDHLERVVARFRHSIQTGESWEDVFPLRGKDGRYRWFLSRAVPIRDDRGQIVKWFGTNTDITEQRILSNATTLLAASLDVKDTLARVAQLAVPDLADWCFVHVLEDASVQRLAAVNADPTKAAQMREWTQQLPATGQPGISQVLASGEPLFIPDISNSVLDEQNLDEPYRQIARQLGITSCVIAPLVARGRTFGTITLLHAESGRRYTRAEMEAAVELGRRAGIAIDNARLYGEAQDAVHAREEILAIVSHDLRSPLNVIDLGATMAVTSGEVGPKAQKHVDSIQRSAARMERLLSDLLDTAALQVGRLTLQRKREDASSLITEALDGHAEVASKKGVTIIRECEVAGAYVDCDRGRVVQAIGNLLGNAIKFCSPGDVIRVRGSFDHDHLTLSIADTGPGIAPNELPHIFEPYWSAKRHARKGTGLGLFICKGIIEAHAGEIGVQTTPGEGTTFTVKLPLARPETNHG